jgi:uncharacterized membrane protein
MSIIFLPETLLVASTAVFIIVYHVHLYIKVRQNPLTTAIGITNHALNLLGTKTETLWMFKLMLLGLLFFFTFFNFTLSIRYYNHAGFMINTFEKDDATVSEKAVTQVINHGALHYTIGMRGFYLSVPLALWLFGPIWLLTGGLLLIAVLYRLDREA